MILRLVFGTKRHILEKLETRRLCCYHRHRDRVLGYPAAATFAKQCKPRPPAGTGWEFGGNSTAAWRVLAHAQVAGGHIIFSLPAPPPVLELAISGN